jgi:hypothetical protein
MYVTVQILIVLVGSLHTPLGTWPKAAKHDTTPFPMLSVLVPYSALG